MHKLFTIVTNRLSQRIAIFWVAVSVAVVVQDWLSAFYHGGPFYLTESLLFKVLWLCFIPLSLLGLHLAHSQQQAFTGKLAWPLLTSLVVFLSAAHLILCSLLVHLVSSLFFSTTFGFLINLQVKFYENLYLIVVVYAVLAIFIRYRLLQMASPAKTDKLYVRQGRQTLAVAMDDIVYLQSDAPYVAIHTTDRKLLHTGTLQQLQDKLKERDFVRIHRSTIVNTQKVRKLQSRLNGDYDLLLETGTIVRLSRNYRQRLQELLPGSSA